MPSRDASLASLLLALALPACTGGDDPSDTGSTGTDAVGTTAPAETDTGTSGEPTGNYMTSSQNGDTGLPETTTEPTGTTDAGTGTTADTTDTTDTTDTGGPLACDVPLLEISHDETPTAEPHMHILDPGQHPDALCNDGTPATYLLRPGAGAASKRWLIYLEGGGQCATGPDCLERFKKSKGLMSSMGAVEGAVFPTVLEGIKSTDAAVNPDFHDATYVQLQYCSSDAWSGDVAGDPDLPTSDAKRWHFRGRAIVEAVLADLQAKGLADADEVLLLGSSAGGLGTLVHTDDVHAALAPTTRFAALVDAGFFIDYPSYDPMTGQESDADPTERYLQLQYAASVWGGRGDASCEAQAGDDAALLACRSAVDLLLGEHIAAPMLIRQSQRDTVQIKSFIDPGLKTPAADDFRARWSDHLRAQLQLLGPRYAVFSTFDAEHGVVNATAEWDAAMVDGVSLQQAIGLWYRDPCGGDHKWIAQP